MHDFCLTIPYGMIIMCGGVIGYLSAGSTASLVAGGTSGGILTLLGYCGYWEFKRDGASSSLWTLASSVVSLALTSTMGKRLYKTGKLMPALPLGALSLGMSMFYIYKLAKAKSPPKKSS